MAIKKCKDCGQDVSTSAKQCPHCGSTKHISFFNKHPIISLVLILVFLTSILNVGNNNSSHYYNSDSAHNINKANSSENKEPVINEEDTKDGISKNIDFKYEWNEGGFGSIMLLDMNINNKSKHTIRDFVVECTSFANSGTRIDSNEKTIYDIVKAGSKKSIKKFNMGFIHSQAAKTHCEITDFKFE